MVDVKDINPVTPVWPTRPPEDIGKQKEQSGRDRGKERQRRKDDDSGEHQIDEFA